MISCPSPSFCPWVNPEAAFGCAGSGLLCWWHLSMPLLESWLPLVLCAQSSLIRPTTMSSPICIERTLDSWTQRSPTNVAATFSLSSTIQGGKVGCRIMSVGMSKQSRRLSSWLAWCGGQALKVRSVPNNMQSTCLSPPCVCSSNGVLWGEGWMQSACKLRFCAPFFVRHFHLLCSA